MTQAHGLAKQIDANTKLLAAYREAVIVGAHIPEKTGASPFYRRPHEVVSALERRIATLTEALRELGVA